MNEQKDVTKYKEVDGFMDWRDYYKFINTCYSDVSLARLQRKFEIMKETMRELIDNSCPYHSTTFEAMIDGKKKTFTYDEYYELLVDAYEKAMHRTSDVPLTPDEEEKINEAKDLFMKETRRLRRMIMTDLATAKIIPKASEKKIQKRAENMEGVGL